MASKSADKEKGEFEC